MYRSLLYNALTWSLENLLQVNSLPSTKERVWEGRSDRVLRSEYKKKWEGGVTERTKAIVQVGSRYYVGLYKYNWHPSWGRDRVKEQQMISARQMRSERMTKAKKMAMLYVKRNRRRCESCVKRMRRKYESSVNKMIKWSNN